MSEVLYRYAETAVQNRNLNDLFLGTGNFRFNQRDLKHIPASVPSDISGILKDGLYKLYKETQFEVTTLLIDAIINLSNGSPVEIWTAYNIIWFQYRYELNGISPFKIISQDLLNKIQKSVFDNSDALESCCEYEVKDSNESFTKKFGYNNGLLGDILSSNESFIKKFGISIL